MRKLVAGMLAAASLLVVPVAATAGDTSVSFTVASAPGAALSISHDAASATLTDGGAALGFSLTDGTVSGQLPATTVTDQRGTLAGAWAVSVSGTDFVNDGDAGVTVGAANGRAYLDAADLTTLTGALGAGLDGMLLTGAELAAGTSDLGTPYTLVAGTTTLGNGSITYTPAMDVTVPAGTPAGTYTATVTQTVS